LYRDERFKLKYFDLILCPTSKHLEICRKEFPKILSFLVGSEGQNFIKFNNDISFKKIKETIIFAPTELADLNWLPLLDGLIASGLRVLVKNHLYWDFEMGAPPPRGQESRYARHKIELELLENYVKKLNSKNLILIDRRTKISLLYPDACALLTDCSSVALEFTSYGIAYELGTFDPVSCKRVPNISLLSDRVIFIEEKLLLDKMVSGKWKKEIEESQKLQFYSQENFGFPLPASADQLI
jgi:hypothetical protein